jgi:type IV pilus assembly protein PilM
MATFLHRFANLLHDPPPDFIFEMSESGIAHARPGTAPAFQPLEPGVLQVSPLTDNVLKPDALADAVRAIVGQSVRKRRAVVILPDYSARISVLGFDQFPTDPREQASLVRFRMKKSVPFDVETAAVSYHSQATKGPSDVVVAVAALEIVSRYEAAFRAAGLHPGRVTTGAVTMSELVKAQDVSVIARRNGRLLTVVVMNGPLLKLVRTVELISEDPEEILNLLFPTLAYIEDDMSTHPSRILLCGFEEGGRIPEWVSELQIPAERLQSRFGAPNGTNAGLLGYLESTGAGVKAA